MHQNDKNTHIRTLISSSLIKKDHTEQVLVLFTMLCYLLLDYQLRFIINDHFSVCDLRAKKPFKTLLHTMHEHCPLVIIKKARSDVIQWADIFSEGPLSFSYSRNFTRKFFKFSNCLKSKRFGLLAQVMSSF